MRTATIDYEVYKYEELTEEAKEKVKTWYLEGQEPYFFSDDCKMDLENLFGKNELDVQFSLSYCQGDGFNIYGKIYAEDIIECLEKHNGGTQLAEFEDVLTEKEKKTILNYAKECGAINLPMNNRCCYSLANYIDIADDWEYQLEYYSYYTNINTETLKKFETLVRDIFGKLCKSYEKWGYEFFYEISDEDLEEFCEANEYEFLADGTVF
jgi:hypothetical protein